MDIKRFFTAMLISAVVMMALMYFFGSKQPPPAAQSAAREAAAPTVTPAAPPAKASPTTASATPPVAVIPGTPPPTAPPEMITLGSAAHGAPYKLQVVVNNVHASIESVELNIDEYSETVKRLLPLKLLQADSHTIEPFATTHLSIDGQQVSLLKNLKGDPLTWYVDKAHTDSTTATLYAIIYTDVSFKTPWVRVEKIFQIDPKSYNVTLTYHVINQSDQPVTVQIDQTGPISLWDTPPDDFRTDSRTFQTATYDSASKQISTAGKPTKLVYQQAITGEKANVAELSQLGTFTAENRVVWLAASNRFFTSIVRPISAEPLTRESIPPTDFLDSATVEPEYIDEALPLNSIAVVYLTGKPVTVAANASRNMALSLYMGPKKKQILAGDPTAPVNTPQYAFYAYDYMGVIDVAHGGCYSYIPFLSKLAFLILQMLDWIHIVTRNWGVAIIILVILVRLIMHPLTRSSQISMATMQQKMAEVKPELDRVKRKYPKDTAMQQQEKIRIFKEHHINPAGSILGCLPMMLQMPIWAALYAGLAADIDLRQAGFIPGWITDLSNPDMIWGRTTHPFFHLPMLGSVYGLNLLPILLGLVFFVQMRYSMKSSPKPADPQQAQTQKISQFMFLLFPVMLYNAPSGLNLYIFASSVAGFFDTWLVRRHMKEMGILPAQMAPTL